MASSSAASHPVPFLPDSPPELAEGSSGFLTEERLRWERRAYWGERGLERSLRAASTSRSFRATSSLSLSFAFSLSSLSLRSRSSLSRLRPAAAAAL